MIGHHHRQRMVCRFCRAVNVSKQIEWYWYLETHRPEHVENDVDSERVNVGYSAIAIDGDSNVIRNLLSNLGEQYFEANLIEFHSV